MHVCSKNIGGIHVSFCVLKIPLVNLYKKYFTSIIVWIFSSLKGQVRNQSYDIPSSVTCSVYSTVTKPILHEQPQEINPHPDVAKNLLIQLSCYLGLSNMKRLSV